MDPTVGGMVVTIVLVVLGFTLVVVRWGLKHEEKKLAMESGGGDIARLEQVLVATQPVDFRKQMDGLAALVQQAHGADPYCGAVYVFRSRRADRVKLLWWDGTGICLLTKRLEGAKFCWPAIADGVMRLSPAQLSALLEGLDWARVHMRRVRAPEATL